MHAGPSLLARRPLSGTVVLILTVALVLAAVGCSDDESGDDGSSGSSVPAGTPQSGGTLRLGTIGLDSLDPLAATATVASELVAADLLYDGLTTFDPHAGESGTVVPSLAEWQASDDLRTWTFTLDEGATFSDGSPVTADDVKFTLERVAQPGDESSRGVRLEVIEGYDGLVGGGGELSGITVVDDRTVEIATTGAFAELPAILSDPVFGVVSRAVVEEDPDGWAEEPVGSGPFAFASRGGDTVRLERVPDAAAYVDVVELMSYDDAAAAYEAFSDGALDWSPVPDEETAAAVDEYGDGAIVPYFVELWFGMNLGSPVFDDAKLREAIVRAIDREAIADEFWPEGRVLDGVVPVGVPGGREDACGDRCAHDPERARTLLGEAFPGGAPPTIALDFDEDLVPEGAASAIEADLQDVGLTVEMRPKPGEEYRSFVVSDERELFQFGWVGIGASPDSYLAPLFTSDSGDNVTGYSNDGIDAGIAAARGTADDAERLSRYQTVEDAVLAGYPIVPLVQFRTDTVVASTVQDLVLRPDGTFLTDAIWLAP